MDRKPFLSTISRDHREAYREWMTCRKTYREHINYCEAFQECVAWKSVDKDLAKIQECSKKFWREDSKNIWQGVKPFEDQRP